MTADFRSNTKGRKPKDCPLQCGIDDKGGGMSSDEREKGSHEEGVLLSY